MAVLWPLVVGKCALVVWTIERWSVPVAPSWIVVPTLAFAALATVLWLAHRDG